MKELAVVFCWIFFVLLVHEVNYQPPKPQVYFNKTLVVSQNGEGANLSLQDFNELGNQKDWGGWTFALMGDFVAPLTMDISGNEKEQVVIDGNFFGVEDDYQGYATITSFYSKGEECENGCKE